MKFEPDLRASIDGIDCQFIQTHRIVTTRELTGRSKTRDGDDRPSGSVSRRSLHEPLPVHVTTVRQVETQNASIPHSAARKTSRCAKVSTARSLNERWRKPAMPHAISNATSGCLELAHVLFMDIVGFSLLLVDEQRQVIQRLQNLVRELHGLVADDLALC